MKQTSETEIPKDWNFLAYCLLDFVELLVTNTNFLPWQKYKNKKYNPIRNSKFWDKNKK